MLCLDGEAGLITLKVKDAKVFVRGKLPFVWKAGTNSSAYNLEP
jgi:hypothetical protein